MERTLGLSQERFFWPKMAEDVWKHIHTCDRCIRFKQPQEKSEMQPILVSYPLELELFPIQTVTDQDLITTTTESSNENRKHVALMKANVLINIHFDK